MKFKIQAGGTIDVATRDEVRQEIAAASASWFTEVARGDRYKRFSAFGDSDAAGNVVIGDHANDGQLGPLQGFVWAVSRLAVATGYAPEPDSEATILTQNPAVGNAAVFVDVPAGETWELVGVRATLVTSAAAGNRGMEVRIQNPAGTTVLTVTTTAVAGPTVTRVCNWWLGGAGAQGSGDNGLGLPENMPLVGGTRITLGVFSFDPADQITSVYFHVRRRHSLSLSIGAGNVSPSGIIVPQLDRYNDLTGNPVVLYPGDSMAIAGKVQANTRVWVTGQARELPLSLAWRL